VNKTAVLPADKRPATRCSGLTSGLEAEIELQTMKDNEIITAFEKLHRLHSTSGEAVGQFAAIGAIREVIFRPGSTIFVAYERDGRETQEAVSRLGDHKAAALMNEMMNLTGRMIQLEATLPPARPYTGHPEPRRADNNPAPGSAEPLAAELNLAGLALYLGSGTLWNYLARTMPRLEIHLTNRYVLSQPELIKLCKWNGATSDDIEVVIDKVAQHLAAHANDAGDGARRTICRRGSSLLNSGSILRTDRSRSLARCQCHKMPAWTRSSACHWSLITYHCSPKGG
jgi:hypothetical protein